MTSDSCTCRSWLDTSASLWPKQNLTLSITLTYLNHFLRAVDSLRRKGSPYSRDRIPAHARNCIPIQHSAAASPFWGPAVHQSTTLIPLGQWDIRMFLLVVARERRSTKPIHSHNLGWCAGWYTLQNMRFLEIMRPDSSSSEAQGKDPCNYVGYIVDKWISQVTHFHPCRIQLLPILLSSDQDVPLLNRDDLMKPSVPIAYTEGYGSCPLCHFAWSSSCKVHWSNPWNLWFSWHVDVKDLTTTP